MQKTRMLSTTLHYMISGAHMLNIFAVPWKLKCSERVHFVSPNVALSFVLQTSRTLRALSMRKVLVLTVALPVNSGQATSSRSVLQGPYMAHTWPIRGPYEAHTRPIVNFYSLVHAIQVN